MPNARLSQTVAHSGIRSSNPNADVRSTYLGARTGYSQVNARTNTIPGESTSSSSVIPRAGYSIGLLLALTYATDIITSQSSGSGFKPNARVT